MSRVGTLLSKIHLFRPRLPFVGLGIAATAGIFLADRLRLPLGALLTITAVFAVLAWITRRSRLCFLLTAVGFASVHTLTYHLHPARDLAAALAAGPRVAEVVGLVNDDPRPLTYFSRKQSGTFRLGLERIEIGEAKWRLSTKLSVTWAGPLPQYGDRVRIRGSLQGLGRPRNPGQFDFGEYLRRQGVFAKLEADMPQDCRVLAQDQGNPIVALSFASRTWMQRQLSVDLEDSPDYASLISSMVLGLRGETPDEIKDLFRRTGTLHLFAVSGLNVAMLGYIAWLVLKPLGIGRRAAVFIIIPLLAFYALITGLSASCVRAALMASLVLLGEFLERRTSVYNSLAAAALLILAWDSNQLFSASFQFSFVLVFVIVSAARPLQNWLAQYGEPDAFLPRVLWTPWQQRQVKVVQVICSSVAVTLTAWLGSLFFSAGYFHLFSPSAIVANLVAVPIAFCVLALGLLTLLTIPFAKGLALVFANANWLCAKGLLASVDFFAGIPLGHTYVELRRPWDRPAGEFTVLDVSDGAAVHLRGGNDDWLIDAGSKWRYPLVTLPYLRTRGINRLDGFLITHGDAQHIGGAQTTLTDFEPHVFLDSPLKDRSSTRRKLHTELSARGLGKVYTQRGDHWPIGATKLDILFPPSGLARSIADDKAIVCRFECSGIRVLLMSDSGLLTEQWLLENEPYLAADILIKGHHSRDFSATPDFITKVNPQAIVVSQQRYGTVSEALDPWEAEMTARGIAVFRQDRCGAVLGEIRDGACELRGYFNDQLFRSRAR